MPSSTSFIYMLYILLFLYELSEINEYVIKLIICNRTCNSLID